MKTECYEERIKERKEKEKKKERKNEKERKEKERKKERKNKRCNAEKNELRQNSINCSSYRRVMVRDASQKKHHGRNVTASNHQCIAKHHTYCDSEYFRKGN